MSEVMERLRTDTRDLHEEAEGQDFQQRMVRGALVLGDYTAWLEQMYLVHRALEARLSDHMPSDPRFAAVTPQQLQVPYLLEDLEAVGADVEAIEPLAATRDLLARIDADAQDEPLALLGYHYVLEGSNNGNRFIARRLLPTLGLQSDRGGRYLDPYGAAQPGLWGAFKTEMGRIDFTAEEIEVLVAAARRMFAAIAALSAELAQPSPSSAAAGSVGAV